MHLDRAEQLCREVYAVFCDEKGNGFYLYGYKHEVLILCPKETYDGAIPSGNSIMAWNLMRLSQLVFEERYGPLAER